MLRATLHTNWERTIRREQRGGEEKVKKKKEHRNIFGWLECLSYCIKYVVDDLNHHNNDLRKVESTSTDVWEYTTLNPEHYICICRKLCIT